MSKEDRYVKAPPKDQKRRTPRWLIELLETKVIERKFKLDAAADAANAVCKLYINEVSNGLVQPWVDPTFCNPGFAHFGSWIRKGYQEAKDREIVVVMLGPTGCSQKWFHEVATKGRIYAPDHRINFDDALTGEPTRGADRDTMIYTFGPGFWNRGGGGFDISPLRVRDA